MLPQIWGGKQPGNHAWMQDLDVALSDKRRFENSVWILESITWQPLMKSINWQMLPIYAFSRTQLFAFSCGLYPLQRPTNSLNTS
jgi:hypothetical protein